MLDALDYQGPIIDPHIHLWDARTTPRTASRAVKLLGWSDRLLTAVANRAFPRASLDFVGTVDHIIHPYLPATWRRETEGRDVRGFVHVQADWQGEDQSRETAWLEEIGGDDLLAIVGRADLQSPELDRVLDAHEAASPRFRGIRDYLAHNDGHEGVMSYASRPDTAADPRWREGYARLGARGLSFDAWCFGHQLAGVAALAADVPDTPLVLDHVGSPIAVGGPFGGLGLTPSDRQQTVERWRQDIAAVAASPQAHVKLSGLAMPVAGFGWHHHPQPPSVAEVVDAFGPFLHHTIEVFGPDRCMFASNFPMDRPSLPWTTLFDAFAELVADRPLAEQQALFHDTAAGFYRL